MAKRKSESKWLISDRLWKQIEPLIPKKKNTHKFGGGRPRSSDRAAMNGIFYVLRTGAQWKSLDVRQEQSVGYQRYRYGGQI